MTDATGTITTPVLFLGHGSPKLALEHGPWQAVLQSWIAAHRGIRSVPTSEHFDPLYVTLGAAGHSPCLPVYTGWQHGNLSLRAVSWE